MSKQCSLGSGEFYIDKIQKAIILTILLPSSAMWNSPQSRPNPPIYWKQRILSVLCLRTVTVIEDVAAGIAAAKAAEMACIAYYTPNSDNQDLSHADWIAESFDMIEPSLHTEQ